MQFHVKNNGVIIGTYMTSREQPIPINGDTLELPITTSPPIVYKTYEIIGRIFTYRISTPIPTLIISVKEIPSL